MIQPDGPYATREGLLAVSALPQADAQQAVLRSLPRITEAILLRDRVVADLGERLVADATAGQGNSLLFLRDTELPAFVVSHPLLLLDANVPPPAPILMATLELPEHLRPKEPEEPEEPEAERPRMLPGPHRFPGMLRISEGPAYIELSYGADGARSETVQTAGDSWTWGHHQADRPFTIDPFVKPPQLPPLGLYCRDDLDPDGHDIGTMATMVAELDPSRLVKGRVYIPVPMPGGVSGGWIRGLWRLREALWSGRIPDDAAGWVVIDAWTGAVAVVGPTLATAFEAWQEAVVAAQPLPPVDPKPAPRPDIPDEAPSSSYDEATKTTRLSSGTIRITSVPRVTLDWPEATPQNVPAIAVPIAPMAPFPPGWEGYGFTGRVRLIGEHGEVCTAFVRDEGDGAYTLIGEGAIPALDPAGLDAELDRIDEERRVDIEETWFPGRPSPYTDPSYPWMAAGYRAWDDLGRTPKLREGGMAWTAELAARDLDAVQLRWMIRRTRPSTRTPIAANRPF